MRTFNKYLTPLNILVCILILFILTLSYLIVNVRKHDNKYAPSNSRVEVLGDNTQYIDITVKGGYQPKTIDAKANAKTVLRLVTKNTFDCSAAIVIPSLNYSNNLPSTGITEVDIPAQKKGNTIKGSCAMGMYGFSINFN
jgi:plastocyanin domain-containing protein